MFIITPKNRADGNDTSQFFQIELQSKHQVSISAPNILLKCVGTLMLKEGIVKYANIGLAIQYVIKNKQFIVGDK